jgi:hypothetical protein
VTGYLDRLVARASGASPSRIRPRRPAGYDPAGPYEPADLLYDEPAVRGDEPIGLRDEPVAGDDHLGGRGVEPTGRQDKPTERRGEPAARSPLIELRLDKYHQADPWRVPAAAETGGVPGPDVRGDRLSRPSFVGRTTSPGTGDSSSVEVALPPPAEPAAGTLVESWGHDGPEPEASQSALGFGSKRPAAPALAPGQVGKRGPVATTPGAVPATAAAGGETASGPSAATRVHQPLDHADQQPALDGQTPKPRAPADPAPGSRASAPRPRVATPNLPARGPTESASPPPGPDAPDWLPAQASDYVRYGWPGPHAEPGRRPERPGERHPDQEGASGEPEPAITVVDVTIGRIEIRPAPAQRPEPRRREQAEPPLSLHDYLEKRRR